MDRQTQALKNGYLGDISQQGILTEQHNRGPDSPRFAAFQAHQIQNHQAEVYPDNLKRIDYVPNGDGRQICNVAGRKQVGVPDDSVHSLCGKVTRDHSKQADCEQLQIWNFEPLVVRDGDDEQKQQAESMNCKPEVPGNDHQPRREQEQITDRDQNEESVRLCLPSAHSTSQNVDVQQASNPVVGGHGGIFGAALRDEIPHKVQQEENAQDLKTPLDKPLGKLRIGNSILENVNVGDDQAVDEAERGGQESKIPVVVRAQKIIYPVIEHHD